MPPSAPIRCVYALVSSAEPHHYRYVGQTRRLPRYRLADHTRRALAGGHLPLHDWIRDVLASGHGVTIVPLQECADDDGLNEAECLWIAHLKQSGHALLNVTAGGGYVVPTPETRARIKASLTPEVRARMSVSLMNKCRTPSTATRTLIQQGVRRYAASPEGQAFNRDNNARRNHVRWHVNRGVTAPGCPHCLTGSG